MKNITSIIFAAVVSLSLFSCSEDEEIIGYDMTKCGNELVVTSPLISNSTTYSGSLITFSAELEVDRPWVFTAKAASGATYTEEGYGKNVEVKWGASTTILPLFAAGDVVETELSFICIDDVVSGPTITLNQAKDIPNLLYHVTSFDNEQFASVGDVSFHFTASDTPDNLFGSAHQNILIQDFGYDDPDTTYVKVNGTQAEGLGYYELKGKTLVDDNFFLAGCAVDSEGIGSYPSIDSTINLKDIFFNIFVRSDGNPNARFEVIIKEDVDLNLSHDDNEILDEFFIKKIYTKKEDAGKWVLHSFQLNELFPDPEQKIQNPKFDKKLDLSKVIRFQFNLINDTGKKNDEVLQVDIDNALLTLGSPVQY